MQYILNMTHHCHDQHEWMYFQDILSDEAEAALKESLDEADEAGDEIVGEDELQNVLEDDTADKEIFPNVIAKEVSIYYHSIHISWPTVNLP